MKKLVAINFSGRRIGETHHRAKFTDDEIETILFLREAGLSFAQIAAKWDEMVVVMVDGRPTEAPGKRISKSTVRDICNGLIRAQVPDRYKGG